MVDNEKNIMAMSDRTMAPALISVHPRGEAIVVAIGAGLRIFNLVKNAAVEVDDGTTPGLHGDAIRAVAFDRSGNFFASAGDDKLVKLWDTKVWGCIKTIRPNKKVTAVAFTEDSRWLLFADKFGVVYVLPTTLPTDCHVPDEPVQLLAHCCSIITGLGLSPDDKYVVTSDRDFKIRVSVFPRNPLKGAHEIWCYCLGHSSFVTCIAVIGGQSCSERLLVSGSGDASVRLWEYETGKLLDSFDLQDLLKDKLDIEIDEEDISRAVIGLAVSPTGAMVAVIIERIAGVLLLECNFSMKELKYLQAFTFEEQVYPTSVVFDNVGRLWLVAGAAEVFETGDEIITPEVAAATEAKSQAVSEAAVAHVKLITHSSGGLLPGVGHYDVCNNEDILGGQALLATLQGNRPDTAEAAAAAEAAELAMRKLLSKREYTAEQRDHRKRFRNDKKVARFIRL